MAETAAVFVSYSYFQNLIRAVSNTGKDPLLSIPQLGLAAGGAGFVTSFVLYVSESIPLKHSLREISVVSFCLLPIWPIHSAQNTHRACEMPDAGSNDEYV